ncbi:MAG: hypothetical protein LM582_04000 [Desulfurococcaceae archaeon]|jgi:ABC-type dipeptide/oligopeptide/nickel transport system permease subunit|nr:hypothetical protein [Desulfurococcaceae archaeon]
MVKCSSTRDVLRTYFLVQLYIIAIMISILGIFYIISMVSIEPRALIIPILGAIAIAIVFIWYKITIRLLRSQLSKLKQYSCLC